MYVSRYILYMCIYIFFAKSTYWQCMYGSWCTSNYMSYLLMDEFMWLGLGSMINSFRKEVLGLPG